MMPLELPTFILWIYHDNTTPGKILDVARNAPWVKCIPIPAYVTEKWKTSARFIPMGDTEVDNLIILDADASLNKTNAKVFRAFFEAGTTLLRMERKASGRPMMARLIALKAQRDRATLGAKLQRDMTGEAVESETEESFWTTDERWLGEAFKQQIQSPGTCTTIEWTADNPYIKTCQMQLASLKTNISNRIVDYKQSSNPSSKQ